MRPQQSSASFTPFQTHFKLPEGRYELALYIDRHIDQKLLRNAHEHARLNRLGFYIGHDTLDVFATSRIYYPRPLALALGKTAVYSQQQPTPTSPSGSSAAAAAALDGLYIGLNTTANILLYNIFKTQESAADPEDAAATAAYKRTAAAAAIADPALYVGEPLSFLDVKNGRPLCVRINRASAAATASSPSASALPARMELLVAFHTGDVLVHDALMNKNIMFNREKIVEKSAATSCVWLPPHCAAVSNQSSDFFIVAHSTGNLYLYNKALLEENPLQLPEKDLPKNHNEKHYVLRNKNPKANPLLKVHLGCSASNTNLSSMKTAVNDMYVSPDGRYLALACADGFLKVLDLKTFGLLVKFYSYYGAFLCCTWVSGENGSNSSILIAGGEDDLVSVFDVTRRALLARGINGHNSFVSCIKYDEFRSDNDVLRFVSCGHDCRLLVWELNKSDLDGVCAPNSDDAEGTQSTVNRYKMPISRNTSYTSLADSEYGVASAISAAATDSATVLSVTMQNIPTFEPICATRISVEPLLSCAVFEGGILTVDNYHLVRFWARPVQPPRKPATALASAYKQALATSQQISQAYAKIDAETIEDELSGLEVEYLTTGLGGPLPPRSAPVASEDDDVIMDSPHDQLNETVEEQEIDLGLDQSTLDALGSDEQ